MAHIIKYKKGQMAVKKLYNKIVEARGNKKEGNLSNMLHLIWSSLIKTGYQEKKQCKGHKYMDIEKPLLNKKWVKQ